MIVILLHRFPFSPRNDIWSLHRPYFYNIDIKINIMKNQERQQYLSEILDRIHDIDERIIELQEWLTTEAYDPNREDAVLLLEQMEQFRDSLQSKYNEIEEDIEYDEEKFREFDRNIFTSIREFDNSFKKSGGIFRGTGSVRRRY